jgi:hypothetical protein
MSGTNPRITQMDKPRGRGKPFEKGNTFGTGRPKLPDELKLILRTTGEQIRRDMCEIWNLDLGDLMELSGSTSGISAGKAALVSCLNNAIQSSDPRGLYVFFDRILGKVQEAVPDDPETPEGKLKERDETISRLVHMITEKPSEKNGKK